MQIDKKNITFNKPAKTVAINNNTHDIKGVLQKLIIDKISRKRKSAN
jgi:hypothetical protein